jgi:hypothetical protein
MAVSRKMRVAQCLMAIGIVPLLLAVIWSISIVAYARSHPGQAGGSDAFLMIALILAGYAATLVLGGGGALWSWFLTWRGIDKRTRATLVLRIIVVTSLVLPLLGYASLYF